MGLFDKLFGRDYKYYIDKCDRFVERGDLGEAMSCLEHADELAGDDSSAKNNINAKRSELRHKIYDIAYRQAKQYLQRGQNDAAQNAIDRAARFVQTDEERDSLNALVEESHKWHEETAEEAHVDGEEKIDGLNPQDKWNLYVAKIPFETAQHCEELGDDFKSAWVDLQEGKFDDAIEKIEKVRKANEEHAKDALVLRELGRAYYGKGEFEQANDFLKQSDDIAPETDTKLLRTEVLWNLKKYDDAETVLQAAHDADPDNNTVLARIAQHGLIAKDYESGIAAVEVLLENIPDDISVQRLAGRLYQESGSDDKALDCYETVNRLFWQVDPRTRKLSFDQNSAAAAANIYIKQNKNLSRAAELLEAIRANSNGTTHIAICLQLAELYQKMNNSAKRSEVLTESTRFMDEALETAKGPERAMLQLQYADICEMIEDKDSFSTCLDEAAEFFSQDASKGHPVAAFYLDLIEKRRAGEPFPPADEMQERLDTFVKDHIEELRAAAGIQPAAQSPSGDISLTSHAEMPDTESVSMISGDVVINGAPTPSSEQINKSANDIIAAMAALAPKPAPAPECQDESGDDADSSESDESNGHVCKCHENPDHVCKCHENPDHVCQCHENPDHVCQCHENPDHVCQCHENPDHVCQCHENPDHVCQCHENPDHVCQCHENPDHVCQCHEKPDHVCQCSEKNGENSSDKPSESAQNILDELLK